MQGEQQGVHVRGEGGAVVALFGPAVPPEHVEEVGGSALGDAHAAVVGEQVVSRRHGWTPAA
ncbi:MULTISPECIES: hypothetical protein [Streptomyces]|uniref:Uncharacterized protein n=1 Tax=Streptomyces griseosporeus TaxID=1910 RepID=A0ABV3KN19_STRGS|nr:hypothetical protein [Streptomyces actuosus]MBM4824654.1 hypothetical protein [Streptomyces actuosus]